MSEKCIKIPNFYLNNIPSNPVNNVAMICTASKGYENKYINLIYSHYIYCRKYNYDYILFTEVTDKPKWEIIYKSNEVLEKHNYETIIMIDADIFIQSTSPNLVSLLNECSIYIANGISQRPNSGLIMLRNDTHALMFLKRILEIQNPQKIELKNRVTDKGENGAVIQVLSHEYFDDKKFILDYKWNNTIPERECYFKHFTNYMKSQFRNDNNEIYSKIKTDELYQHFIRWFNSPSSK